MASAPSRDRSRTMRTNPDPARARPGRWTWAEIDLGAVGDNVRALAALLHPPTRLLAAVKADAYGHGAPAVARAAIEAGAWAVGVATTEEGVQLRREEIGVPILLLGHTPAEDAETVVAHDFSVTVFQPEVVRALSRAASRQGRPAKIHLKIDTGMGRFGVAPADAAAVAREAHALGGIVLEGCFTHFATADEADLEPARAQLDAFRRVLRDVEAAGVPVGLRHAANSAAVLALPESHLDLVRPGIAVYGILPAPHLGGRIRLRRVMRFRTRVAHVKQVPPGTPIGYGRTYRAARATTIATLPVGYADGYPRLLSGNGEVALGGRRLPIAGRVSMDSCTIDAGNAPVRVGDEVELWGDGVPVEEVAERARTIAYEILAGVSRRVPRVFARDGQVVGIRTLLGDDG